MTLPRDPACNAVRSSSLVAPLTLCGAFGDLHADGVVTPEHVQVDGLLRSVRCGPEQHEEYRALPRMHRPVWWHRL